MYFRCPSVFSSRAPRCLTTEANRGQLVLCYCSGSPIRDGGSVLAANRNNATGLSRGQENTPGSTRPIRVAACGLGSRIMISRRAHDLYQQRREHAVSYHHHHRGRYATNPCTIQSFKMCNVHAVCVRHVSTSKTLDRGSLLRFAFRLTELHERAAVGGEDDSHPVEGVRRLGGLDPVNGDLAANQEDEERDDRPQHLFPERNLPHHAPVRVKREAAERARKGKEKRVKKGYTIRGLLKYLRRWEAASLRGVKKHCGHESEAHL